MTQVVPDEAFKIPEEIPPVTLVAYGEVFGYSLREPGWQTPEESRHGHVNQFVDEETLVRARLQPGISRLGRSKEIVSADENLSPTPVPPAYRAFIASGADETGLVLTEGYFDHVLLVGRP